jgi:hypothetical protein
VTELEEALEPSHDEIIAIQYERNIEQFGAERLARQDKIVSVLYDLQYRGNVQTHELLTLMLAMMKCAL